MAEQSIAGQTVSVNTKITLGLLIVISAAFITYGKQSQQIVDLKERMVRMEGKVDQLLAQRAITFKAEEAK